MRDSKIKTETRYLTKLFFLFGVLGGSLASLLFLMLLGSKANHENTPLAGILLVPSARADVPFFDSAGSASCGDNSQDSSSSGTCSDSA